MLFVTAENTEFAASRSFTFKGEGGDTIHALKWLPVSEEIRSVLIINHGMAEHIARYDAFAKHMTGLGFAVYGEDHRGHGRTAGIEENLGFFADEDGWMKVIGDIRSLHLLAADEQKGLPVFMLGHSMGSFLTRHYLSLYGSELSGVVISGTGMQSPLLLNVARTIALMESAVKGKRHRSKILDNLSFGSYNKPFQSGEATGFEWLSTDTAEVRKYVDDPYCGFICTSGFYADLLRGLLIIGNKRCFSSTPARLPILLISGKDDPVGDFGKSVEAVSNLYKSCGVKDLTLKLMEGMRHECLNELDRNKCYGEISEWLTTRIPG